MSQDQNIENETPAPRRRGPGLLIVTVMLCGMAVLVFLDADEKQESGTTVAYEETPPEAEEPGESTERNDPIFNETLITFLDGGLLDSVADLGRRANDIHTARNYGPLFETDDLQHESFEGQVLKGAIFRFADLQNANFRGADLEDALFGFVDIEHADFTGACLLNARFVVADAEHADFNDTYLVGSEFEAVEDGSAVFTGAIREGNEACPTD